MPTPRILIFAPAPGSPEFAVIDTPGTRPCIAKVTSEVESNFISSEFTRDTEPVKSLFFIEP